MLNTLSETNIASENQWLEDAFPFGAKGLFSEAMCSFQGECIQMAA